MVGFSVQLGSGGTGTLSLRSSFESLVRPSVVIESHLKDRLPKPVEVPEQEAEIIWGKASTFQWSVTNPNRNGYGINVNPGTDDGDEDIPPGPSTLEFEETERTVEDIRVENPSDADQYVIVQRINEIVFQAPANMANALIQLRDGDISELFFKYILHHPEPN